MNAVLTAEHFQDYLLESAAAGTDFEKARAIAAGEPSLFWLAVDIVATILDVKAATDVFRRLLPLAESAVAAVPAAREAAAQFGDAVGDVADETPALQALREAGNDEMPGLGDTLVESALRAEQRAAVRAVARAGDAPLVPDAALAFGAGKAVPRPRKANCVYRIMSNAEAAEALEHGRLPAATSGSEPSKYLSLDSDYSALFPQKRLDAARKAGARGEAAKAQDLIEDWHQAPGQTMLLEVELQPGALDEILRRAVTEDALRTYRGADVFIYKLERGAHNIAVPSWQLDTFNGWVKAVRVQGWRAPLGPVKGTHGRELTASVNETLHAPGCLREAHRGPPCGHDPPGGRGSTGHYRPRRAWKRPSGEEEVADAYRAAPGPGVRPAAPDPAGAPLRGHGPDAGMRRAEAISGGTRRGAAPVDGQGRGPRRKGLRRTPPRRRARRRSTSCAGASPFLRGGPAGAAGGAGRRLPLRAGVGDPRRGEPQRGGRRGARRALHAGGHRRRPARAAGAGGPAARRRLTGPTRSIATETPSGTFTRRRPAAVARAADGQTRGRRGPAEKRWQPPGALTLEEVRRRSPPRPWPRSRRGGAGSSWPTSPWGMRRRGS